MLGLLHKSGGFVLVEALLHVILDGEGVVHLLKAVLGVLLRVRLTGLKP